ncbi:MAG: hypothetical protein JWP97_1270 [Labilithrix sp.]|nr:hypothetical protein [Labilithrix sp.]
MGKSIVVGSLLACLVGCGGGIDSAGTGEPAAVTPAEQGVYAGPTSAPETVAEGVGRPTALVTTKDRVLFTTATTTLRGETVAAGALFAADQVNGPALLLAVDRQGASFEALATDGATAFVATSDGRVLAVPAAGGEVVVLATLAAGDAAVALSSSATHVYYATKSGDIARVGKQGGVVEPLATLAGAVHALVAGDAGVHVAAAASDDRPAGILHVGLDGAVTSVAAGAEPCALVRDGADLLWTSAGSPSGTNTTQSTSAARGEVHRLALGSTSPAVTVTAGAFEACSLAASGAALYFAGTAPGASSVRAGGAAPAGFGLLRAPASGGETVALPKASRVLRGPSAVAVTAAHVYWLTESGVLRLRK